MTIPDVAIGPFGWTCIVVGAWLIASCVVAVPIGRAMRRADRDDTAPALYPPPVPPSVRWMAELPPVPWPTYATDADWMALVPVECLSDDEIGLRCADIEAREGWWAA